VGGINWIGLSPLSLDNMRKARGEGGQGKDVGQPFHSGKMGMGLLGGSTKRTNT